MAEHRLHALDRRARRDRQRRGSVTQLVRDQNSGVSRSAAPLKFAISLNAPLLGALHRRAVVTDDVVDERVVEHVELFQRIDDAADVVVGVRLLVLERACRDCERASIGPEAQTE